MALKTYAALFTFLTCYGKQTDPRLQEFNNKSNKSESSESNETAPLRSSYFAFYRSEMT